MDVNDDLFGFEQLWADLGDHDGLVESFYLSLLPCHESWRKTCTVFLSKSDRRERMDNVPFWTGKNDGLGISEGSS